MPATICELANTLPQVIGGILQRETRLTRGRFREETLTDIFTAAFAAFAGPNLKIEYPDEVLTGGDVDLRFWDVSRNECLYLRIQAKRLNAAYSGNEPIISEKLLYKHLVHKPNSKNEFQHETLVDCANGSNPSILPLYMFYNHQSVVDELVDTGEPEVHCLNLAFAHDIAHELQIPKGKKRRRNGYSRLSHLRKYFFSLDTILCPQKKATNAGITTPDDVLDSISELLTFQRSQDYRTNDAWNYFVYWRIAAAGYNPEERVPYGSPIRLNKALKRPRITFISGRDAEDTRENGKKAHAV